MSIHRFYITIILLLVIADSNGEAMSIGESFSEPQLYWVVGSYRNQQAALAESEKLSLEMGMEVLVAPATVAEDIFYRLVIAVDDAEGRQQQQIRLSIAGIDQPWTIRLDPLEIAVFPDYFDTEQSPLIYIVLGSFKDPAEAQSFATEMEEKIGIISAFRSVELDGQIFQRVLIGPYYSVDETQYTRRLVMDEGIDEPWILTESSHYSTVDPNANRTDDQVDEPSANDDLVVHESAITDKQEQPRLQKQGSYSFATLKPRTKPFLITLPAEKKKDTP